MKSQAKPRSSRTIRPLERITNRYTGWGWLRIASISITIIVAFLFVFKITQIIVSHESISNRIPDIYQLLAIVAGALLFTALSVLKEVLTRKDRVTKDEFSTSIMALTTDLEDYPAKLQTEDELEGYVETLERRLNTLEARAELHRERLRAVESEMSARKSEVAEFSMRYPDIWGEALSQTSQYANAAKQYLISSWSATILASALGVYISFRFLDVNIFLLAVINLIVNLSLVYVLSSSLFIFTGAPNNPHALRFIKRIIAFFSIVLLLTTAIAIFIRFSSGSSNDLIRGVILTAEFSLVILAGALHSSYRIFGWARVFDKRFEALKEQRDSLHSQLIQINAALDLMRRVHNKQRERLESF